MRELGPKLLASSFGDEEFAEPIPTTRDEELGERELLGAELGFSVGVVVQKLVEFLWIDRIKGG